MVRPAIRLAVLCGVTLPLSACLNQHVGGDDSTTNIVLSSSDTGALSTSGDDTSTTRPGIETTTYEPVDTDTGGSSSSGGTTETIPAMCGDGVVDMDEQCDDGNKDDSDECLSTCKTATCGDGIVRTGWELCDDAADNGTYGHCNATCTDLGPRCGDGVLQPDEGETCDVADPKLGCLKDTCTWAASCLEIKTAWADAATSDAYLIHRDGKDLNVWCEMDADGGGYTFLKYAAANGVELSAKQAEIECQKLGLHLFVPRSADHLSAATEFADTPNLMPQGGGKDGDLTTYLKILAIYPVMPGQSCTGQALNRDACPQWKAGDGGTYWVSGAAIDLTEPSTSNCAECSMSYMWDANMNPPLVGYEAFKNGGIGATSSNFLCDVGDKQP